VVVVAPVRLCACAPVRLWACAPVHLCACCAPVLPLRPCIHVTLFLVQAAVVVTSPSPPPTPTRSWAALEALVPLLPSLAGALCTLLRQAPPLATHQWTELARSSLDVAFATNMLPLIGPCCDLVAAALDAVPALSHGWGVLPRG
jgi:hypothetical protein